MLTFWLILGVLTTLYCTYKGIVEGFDRWGFMYVFSAISFFMYFTKRYMLNRYRKQMHLPEELRDVKK